MFTITKSDNDKQYVFGWASVAKLADGTEVSDLEGDVITPDEIEKAAYEHVLDFRSTGEKHDPGLRAKGNLIESCVFTKEKQEAIGIPLGKIPEGWWCGYHITDQEAWAKIKSGEYKMFSVEGSGEREEYKADVDKSAEYVQNSEIAKTFNDVVEKYNPYHGKGGRFSSRNAHTTFSPGANPKQAQSSVAAENMKRKKEGMEDIVVGAYQNMQNQPYGTMLNGYLEKKNAVKDSEQEPGAPAKAAESVDWAKMTDKEFANSIEKYMPGITDIAEKGWMSKNNQYNYLESSLNGDMVLTDIYEARGFHGKPQVVNKTDMDKYIAENGTPELYRGMKESQTGKSGTEKQEGFINDELHFAGYGVLGNGTYAAETLPNSTTNKGLQIARDYAKSGYVTRDGGVNSCARLTLKKGTKIAEYESIIQQKKEFSAKLQKSYNNGKVSYKQFDLVSNLVNDVGRFAAIRGYEAWHDNDPNRSGARQDEPYWVITNRSKIIVQKERYDAK